METSPDRLSVAFFTRTYCVLPVLGGAIVPPVVMLTVVELVPSPIWPAVQLRLDRLYTPMSVAPVRRKSAAVPVMVWPETTPAEIVPECRSIVPTPPKLALLNDCVPLPSRRSVAPAVAPKLTLALLAPSLR